MNKPIRKITGLGLLTVLVGTVPAFGGVTPGELADRLESGESIALIDVRSNRAFQENHIPGAMNIPGRIVELRRLPSSRPVVVYDDGLGRADAGAIVERAAEAGRDVVRQLQGGLAAWESAGLATTAPKGFRKERMPGITYHGLKEAQGDNVTLLDIRELTKQPEKSAPNEKDRVTTSETSELTDLAEAFPKARVVRPEKKTSSEGPVSLSTFSPADPAALQRNPVAGLTVVVDNGDGEGEDLVRRLRAQGNKRVVLLIGGERILEREGRPGLERQGMGTRVIDAQELYQEEGR